MTDARSFGDWLRRERERRGIAIRTIADRTKIAGGLLEALERGDVSRWPSGIYRRAFVRSYAEMVGLDGELVLANFERLFPDPEAVRTGAERPAGAPFPLTAAPEPAELRLHLALGPRPAAAPPWVRAAAHVAAAVSLGAIGGVVAGPTGFWSVTALAALAVHLWAAFTPARTPPIEPEAAAPARRPASVVQFSSESPRSSRRARARRIVAHLSVAAIGQTATRRRRASRP